MTDPVGSGNVIPVEAPTVGTFHSGITPLQTGSFMRVEEQAEMAGAGPVPHSIGTTELIGSTPAPNSSNMARASPAPTGGMVPAQGSGTQSNQPPIDMDRSHIRRNASGYAEDTLQEVEEPETKGEAEVSAKVVRQVEA